MIAYFDLDKTFIDGSSGTAWLRSEIRSGSLKWWDVLLGFVWLTLYHVFGVHVGEPMRAAVRRLAGRRAKDFQMMAERVYTSSVRGRARRGALEALAEHRSKGHKVFLLSSSLNFIVDRVAEEYGFDGALSTQLEVGEDGLLTGNIVEPLCFGEGKVERAESHLAEFGLGLRDCVFYSDSLSDLPLLVAAGLGVAVNPDVRLAGRARRLGVPVVDWGSAVLPPKEP